MAAGDTVIARIDLCARTLSAKSEVNATTLSVSHPESVSASVCLDVLNTAAHAIRVRSAAHFFEANRALKFDRAAAFGMKLDQRSGTSVRFQPGEIVRVALIGGDGRDLVRGIGQRTAFVLAGEVRRRGLRRR